MIKGGLDHNGEGWECGDQPRRFGSLVGLNRGVTLIDQYGGKGAINSGESSRPTNVDLSFKGLGIGEGRVLWRVRQIGLEIKP